MISMFQKQGNISSFGLENQDDSMISLFIEKGILGKHFQAVRKHQELLVLIALTLFAGVSLFPMLEMECVAF